MGVSRGGAKPQWGYLNNEGKPAVKQSERDRSCARRQEARLERQRALLEMAQNTYVPGGGRVTKRDKKRDDNGGAETGNRGRNADRKPGANAAGSTKNVTAAPAKKDADRKQPNGAGSDQTPPRRRQAAAPAQKSPAVPAVRHRLEAGPNPSGVDRLVLSESVAPTTSFARYSDRNAGGGERNAPTDFVPFVRSSNFLYPAHADSPLPMSREPTEMERARRGYQAVLNPAKYGRAMERGGAGGNQPGVSGVFFTRAPIAW